MVESVFSLTRSGLRDWLIQRITAVILGAYTLFILGFLIAHPDLQFTKWHELFGCQWVRIFTLLALLSLVWHGWIGVWTIFTDYVKLVWLRLILNTLMILFLIVYLVWGIAILW